MSDKYILKDKTPVPVDDLMQWARWFEKADRKVQLDVIDSFTISTIFLGLDHGYNGEPMLFETMIFPQSDLTNWEDNELYGYQTRCATWEEAEEQHRIAVSKVREQLKTTTS